MKSKLRILNIVLDEKFIDAVIANHDFVHNNIKHDYIIVKDDNESLHFIKAQNRVVRIRESDVCDYINLGGFDAIFLHSLKALPLRVIPMIKPNIQVFWIAWGYDIYETPRFTPAVELAQLYCSKTKKCIRKIIRDRRGIIKNIIGIIRDRIVESGVVRTREMKEYDEAISRIDYFSGILDEEYDLMSENKNFKAKPLKYAYRLFDSKSDGQMSSGTGVIIGNSANPTNNHLDILSILEMRDITEKKVIMPLNYGGDYEYIKIVCEKAKSILKNRFMPLLDFMPFGEYAELLNNCRVAILPIFRQQAIGNIRQFLLMGYEVYFWKESILYKHFKKKGFIVFSIEDDLTKDRIGNALTKDERIFNRKLMQLIGLEEWNPDRLECIYEKIKEKL